MSGFSFDTWKYMFPERILERGEDYYYDGAIDHICRTNHGYQAVAHGSDDYEVAITIKNNRITEMYCDCPYAQDGNNCKHMATLLFELTEGDASLAVIESEKDSKETVDDIIDRMSEEQLKKELKLIAQEQIRRLDAFHPDFRKLVSMENQVRRAECADQQPQMLAHRRFFHIKPFKLIEHRGSSVSKSQIFSFILPFPTCFVNRYFLRKPIFPI